MHDVIKPVRTNDSRQVSDLVRRDGVAILTGCPAQADGAEALVAPTVGEALLATAAPALVRDGGLMDLAKAPSAQILKAHCDGFSYGRLGPDWLGLLCVNASDVGGESFFVDAYSVLDELAASGRVELISFLLDTPIEQTDLGASRYRDMCVITTSTGRRAVRRFPFQEPDRDASATEQSRQSRLLAEFAEVLDEASALAPRVKLLPGDLVWVDNYRVLHGRDPYQDPDRLLVRLWAWSSESNGLPAAELYSDSRHLQH
jgi:alpha-ketoglutarate-dependent taurine dioxygenase